MATNEMRREAAKRKLARQQERRVAQAKRRRRVAVITAASVVVVVLVGVVLLTTIGRGGDPAPAAAAPPEATAAPTTAAAPAAPAKLPPGSCAYPAEGSAAKANKPPKTTGIATTGATKVALTTSAGPIGLTLDAAEAPCAVNSFLSLAGQKYFDGTKCHRLTTGEGLKVLQCGDPTATGSGGPGYTIVDEPPTTLKPAAGGSVVYPRGTVAMAKTSAPNSGGSQFFLVYADSMLPPEYTVFGTIDPAGLATLDTVAKGGSDDANGAGDGAPKTAVTITTAAATA